MGIFYNSTGVLCRLSYYTEKTYKMAVFCEGENNGFFREKKYEFLEPCLRLVKLNYECGNYEKAKVYHNLCKKFYPSDNSVMYNDKFFS